MMRSVTCLRLSHVIVICRVTYFQFPISVCFSSITVARQHSGVRGLPNIGHRKLPKIWEVRFLYAAYISGNDFELILTVKWKLEEEGYFGNEFRAICNH